MRARRGLLIGWLAVAAYAGLLVAAAITTPDARLEPGERPDAGTTEAFIDAWERSREATFVRTGTFERRSEVTGSAISSEDVLAQRPPQRLHRQLGGIDGRDDRRRIVCPSPAEGAAPAPCAFGEPEGSSYAEDVATEIAGLRSLLEGPTPVYGVAAADEAGCFDLAQRRVEPRAPFGTAARFCFDAATGAPASTRVVYAGGIVEVIAVTDIQAEVTDADLRP